MAGQPMTPAEVLTILSATPGSLAQSAAGLSPDQLGARPSGDEWSASEVLAHLRSCADLWGQYIGRILDEDAPTIRVVNPTTYIHDTDYPQLEFTASLRSFTLQRQGLLKVLEPLSAQAWLRSATITGAGAPLQKTVLSYGDRMARHERQHCKQVERALAMVRG